MNTKDKVFVLLEEFKNELKTRLDTIYDLRFTSSENRYL